MLRKTGEPSRYQRALTGALEQGNNAGFYTEFARAVRDGDTGAGR